MAQGTSGRPRKPRGGPSRHQASTEKAQGRPRKPREGPRRAPGKLEGPGKQAQVGIRQAQGSFKDGPGKPRKAQGRSKESSREGRRRSGCPK